MTAVMITGDHPLTARAIAMRLGIVDEDAGDRLITGRELARLSDQDLAARVEHLRVYARVDPEQKIRIVQALQTHGEFVAMTGDGVNDAPALKSADIGVAMGKVGTDVAREASAMVLLDDNFASIVAAVGEGRRIYENIRKFIRFVLAGNTGEIVTLLVSPLLGMPLPLLPIQILWVNLVTDGLPGLALAVEPAEKGTMQRPPRSPRESLFAGGLGYHIVWVGTLIGGLSIFTQWWALSQGSANWQTMVFTVLTFAQLFHVMAIRSDRESLFTIGLTSNMPMLGAVGLGAVLQLAVIYVPALNQVLKTQPLTGSELAFCILLPGDGVRGGRDREVAGAPRHLALRVSAAARRCRGRFPIASRGTCAARAWKARSAWIACTPTTRSGSGFHHTTRRKCSKMRVSHTIPGSSLVYSTLPPAWVSSYGLIAASPTKITFQSGPYLWMRSSVATRSLRRLPLSRHTWS